MKERNRTHPPFERGEQIHTPAHQSKQASDSTIWTINRGCSIKIADRPVAGCVGGRDVKEIRGQRGQVITPRPSFNPPRLGSIQQLILAEAFFGWAFLRETSLNWNQDHDHDLMLKGTHKKTPLGFRV